MQDFNGKEINIGDRVVFALNEFKKTKLQNGIIKEVNIKQANMIMAKIGFGTRYKRVAPWNIYKIQKDT